MHNPRIKQFITERISEIDQKLREEVDKIECLRLATKRVAFSNILNQYLRENSEVVNSLIHQVKAYMDLQCYSEAESQAKLAKKKNKDFQTANDQQINLLIIASMMKQGKLVDSLQILKGLEDEMIGEQNIGKQNNVNKKQYFELVVANLLKLNQFDKIVQYLQKMEKFIVDSYGNEGEQYAFLLVKKGQIESHFGRHQQGIKYMNEGIQLLIEKKCKEKEKVMKIYLAVAENYRKIEDLKKQFSSLICAQAMAKQLKPSEKYILQISHILARNLKERGQIEKALNQYERIKELQQCIYGESSCQLGKTFKKITEILYILNRKAEAKAYELEYSRILGETKQNKILQSRTLAESNLK